ncbi:acetyl-CoA acetyltransferase [Pseudarthrobacter sp. PvP004]|jgi:acetyl-CoA acetyltransferase|uniref:thiolase family protein n=1 Tax=Pseudarthrobacter sp. PvP004 TaxID=2817850 RepID=UPI001AEA9296|nr:thiolase family protein [Pseudarthrobacter sp. PvP004]MBP2269182.1 acetyl-CoA acetyltransferase [Pseudarthrobacter sp. PvP004]
MAVSIIGAGESPYTRHPRLGTTTSGTLVDAVSRALKDAGLSPNDVDGFAVSSFTLDPDHAIDLAWRMGLKLTWLMQDTNGGASAGNMLQHAVHAIEAGDASVVVLAAGDLMDHGAFANLVAKYNRATADHLTPLPMSGPNALFAMLTTRQMEKFGLAREDYGRIAVAQREWAGLNPGAVYRAPLTLEEYLAAPLVAEPLGRFDCVPPVTGADAVVVVADERATGQRRAKILSTTASYNSDNQAGDGLVTGLRSCAPLAWERAGVSPEDVDLISVYDDYPAMVVAQLVDMGAVGENADIPEFIRSRIQPRELAINTSGGQLSAGQAGSAGGMHGLVEAVRQLRGQGGDRQVQAKLAAVSGYGMVLYRYGACANLAVLEASE